MVVADPTLGASSRNGLSLRSLGIACMLAAVITGIFGGLWELARPILASPATFAAAPPAQRWGYGLLQLGKSVGFFAGLFGIYTLATRRGPVLKTLMVLAAAGATFFAAVWLMMAYTGHHTFIYVLGGLWYQMLAPIALGIAALWTRRIAAWQGAWLIVVGLLNAVIFPLLGPAVAQIVQGVIWLPIGWFVLRNQPAPRA